MDSPLEFLRRNQKTMLPVIAIGCMVAFVVLPGVMSMLQDRYGTHSHNSKDPVVAKWQGGNLHRNELQREIHEHQQLAFFMSRLQVEKIVSGNPQYANPQIAGYLLSGMQREFVQQHYVPTGLAGAADAKLLDQIGKDLGIVISDKQVNDFLDDACGQAVIGPDGKPTGTVQTIVPQATYNAMLADITKNDPVFTEARMFQLIQRMLLRGEVYRLFTVQNFFAEETPFARWENYLRIRQRASIQAIPVRVADFVKDVREPKTEELTAFFEANKNRLPDPNSPEVGLRTPVRASYQLAFVNMDTMISSFKPRIDNKAISDYYEKNKDTQFRKSKLPTIDPAKTGDTKPADPVAPLTPKTKSPATKSPEAKPAETGAKAAPEAPKQEPAKKQSRLTRDGLIPVNFQVDPKKEPAKDAAKEPAKTEPGKTEPAKEEPAKTEPVEYIPLAEVESQIRTTLATEQANAQADKLIARIEDDMLLYKKRRDNAINAVEDSSKVKFDELDLAKLTAAIDPTIEVEKLTLVSRDQFAKHPVSVTLATLSNQQFTLGDVAFNEKLFPEYEPIRPRSFSGRYIIWKTEQRGDEVPSLSDPAINARAIAGWKEVEARKDAEKQAKEYADMARKEQKTAKGDMNQTLVQMFNAKLLPVAPSEIGSFSWMTPGLQRNEPPALSKVSGLDNAGHDLMKEIFSLKKDQIGVAANQPKTVYYVVQAIEAEDLTKLRTSFLQDVRTPGGWSQFAAANYDQQLAEQRAFLEQLRQRYKLEFLAPPTGATDSGE